MQPSEIVESALLLLGAGALVASLGPASGVIRLLPAGRIRQFWYLLFTLILLCIGGYLGYAVTHWIRSERELLVSAIFFMGWCSVLIVNVLSLHTALDVRRVAVLEHETITDHLMGIYNRRYLDRRLDEEVARVRRYGPPLSVLMIDLDHFKRINDTYGHQVGDIVLVNLGKHIEQAIRKSDLVARYGGEEIVVLAPNTTGPTAATLAEKLRQKVESSVLVPPEKCHGETIHVTVSIGVAEFGQSNGDGRALLERADQAMYRAKSEGRNRIAIQSSPMPSSVTPV